MCGDSTSPEYVERLLIGIKPYLMVTDPPYGVSFDPAWRKAGRRQSQPPKLGKVANDDRDDWRDPGRFSWFGRLRLVREPAHE